jgi:hypothetical protein
MSYNGSGTFQINTSGQPVVAGTVISSTAFNALTADLATGLSTAITKDGQTTATARIPFAQGISSTLTTDSSSVSTGSIITAGGIGAAKAAYIGTTLNVGGASTFTGAIVVDSVTDSSSTTTGSIQTDGGVGIAKALFVGTNVNVAGTLGVTGVATFSAAPIYSSLTASSAVATDASKALVSVTNTGTGNNVLATSPTLVTPVLGVASATSITVAAGTVSDPAITTTGDTNTGIFFPAADTIAFSEGGVESMRIDSSGNLLFNSGYGSVATAYGCRAWVNFDGTGTPAIRASGNVSSITDNGTGDYTVNFTTAMPDVNYAVEATGNTNVTTGGGNFFNAPAYQATSTTAVRLATFNQGGSNTDMQYVNVAIFR